MSFIRFILHSFLFRRIVIATIGFIVILLIINMSFDKIWKYSALFPVVNLNNFYQIPKSYDNISRINIKLVGKDRIAIECNKKFRIFRDSYDYYDTVKIENPDAANPVINKIFIRYQNTEAVDSLYLVLTKSDKTNIYWNQIFYSSVIVSKLNNFSKDSEEFRIHENELVSDKLLANNDSLIQEVIRYFNVNNGALGLAECGSNSQIFNTLCSKYQLPCRVVELQGGDALYDGYGSQLGYPLHVVCEVYSSKNKKWFVVDPTYGSIYTLDSVPLSAVEISNRFFFRETEGIVQDSAMVTKKTILGKDYYKYYENVYFSQRVDLNFILNNILRLFYKNFYYEYSLFSNNMNFYKNGLNYFAVKSITFFIISLTYFYVILFFISKRLLIAKWKIRPSINK